MTNSRQAPVATERRPRIESIDVVRGLIMIVMALDHTRDYFGIPGQSPTNLATASAALFMTRWVTNICAPVFFLLTGTGSFLSLGRKSSGELARFLVTRGIWLILLDTVVLRCLAYQFNADFHVTILLVLWALGWSMIALAALVWLPVAWVAAIGVLMIVGHNLLDGVQSQNPFWIMLHSPGFVINQPGHTVFAAYPVVPWIGVTAVGFALGQVYRWDGERRRRFLLRGGLLLSAGFVLLRAINGYGDPARWSAQATPLFTVLSFINTTKYPPSLLFLLMTLGPALLLLRSVDRGTPRLLQPALVIGAVPLFYYMVHFFVIHLLAVITALIRFGSANGLADSPDLGHYPFSAPDGWGYALPGVYLMWLLVVLLLYPACQWFAGVKHRRSDWWVSYL